MTCPSGKLKTEFTTPIAKSTSPTLLDTTFFAPWQSIIIIFKFFKCWGKYNVLVYTKTVDSVFRTLWLATQSVNILHYSLIHLQFLQVRNAKLAQVSSKMPSRFAAITIKQRNFTTNQASCSRNIRRRWLSSGRKFKQIKLCLFYLNLLIKPAEKFFVYKCKLVDLFIYKLKPKVNNLFYMRMIFNTKRIYNSFWGNFPARAKQMPLKVLFVSKKRWQPQPFGHRAPKL